MTNPVPARELPEGEPPHDEVADTLETVGFGQAVSLARDWGEVLGGELAAGRPVVSSVAGDDVLAGTRFPVYATVLEISGAAPAFVHVLSPFDEIAPFFAAPLRAGEGRTEEALRELFAFLAAATDRAFRKGVSTRFKVVRATSTAAHQAAELGVDLLVVGCRSIQIDLASKDGRLLTLRELVPNELADALSAVRRAEGRLLNRGPTTIHRRIGSKATVMVVDDHILIRRVLKWQLEKEGYQVIEATDGTDALHKLLVHRPNLVLSDVMMPEMDGFELCRRIRAHPQLAHIPLIFCSARDTKEDVVTAIQAGAQDYIVKPFQKKVLLEKISRVLGEQGSA